MNAEQQNTEIEFDRAVIRIVIPKFQKQKDYSEIYKVCNPFGTGFLVSWENELFIVTARHVAEVNFDLCGIVRGKNKITGKIEIYKLNLQRDRWIFHPEIGDENTQYVDVAAMKISWPDDIKVKAFQYNFDFLEENEIIFFLNKNSDEPNYFVKTFCWLSDWGENSLDPTRPLPLFGELSKYPNLKASNIKNNATNKYFNEKVIFIAGDAFHGNSGGPVIDIMPFDNPKRKLLGLLIASDIDKYKGHEGAKPIGIAAIEPIFRIKETLKIAKTEKQSLKNIDFWNPVSEFEFK